MDSFADEVVTKLTPGVEAVVHERDLDGSPGKCQKTKQESRGATTPPKQITWGLGDLGHAQTSNKRGQQSNNTEMTTSGQNKKFKLNLIADLLLSKPTRTASKTITGHVPSSKQHINYNQQLQNKTIQQSN